MDKRNLVIAAALVLGGCAHLSPEQIPNQTNYTLCLFYADHQDPTIRAELAKRKAFTDQEWQWIDTQRIGIGESRDAMICSMGVPYAINTTTAADGTHVQYVFDHVGIVDTYTYVYTDNDVVTAVQN